MKNFRNNNHIFILTLVYFFIINLYSQTLIQENSLLSIPDSLKRSHSSFKIPDSLKNKSFTFLEKRFYENFDNYKTALLYANTYYRKASKNDTIYKKAKALLLISRITDGPPKIPYLDSVIKLTEGRENKYYPASGYFEKAQYYFEKQDYKDASDNYIKTNYFAKKFNNMELENTALFSLGILKSRLGKIKEAQSIFNKCYTYSKAKYLEDVKYIEGYLYALFAKSDTFTRLKQLDSATIINEIGIKESLKNKDSILYNYFVMNEGVNLYFKNQYDFALDSISKALPILEKIEDQSNVIFSYFYLGKAYYGKNDTVKAIRNFKIVDSLFSKQEDYAYEIRENYELLLDYYKKNNNLKNQLIYLEKLITVDSVLSTNYKYIDNNITKNFDTPRLVTEKEEIIHRISSDKKKMKTKLYVVFLVLLIAIAGVVYNYSQRRLYRTKFQELLATTNDQKLESTYKKTENTTLDNAEDLNISDDIVNKIEEHLGKFEEGQGFLQRNITVNSLAKSMGTNSKYLAKTIKNCKNKKFIDYINDLRISYATKKLKEDKKFRKYTIEAIAENSGFSNPRSFSQAFYKNNGIKPSYFIRELNKLGIN